MTECEYCKIAKREVKSYIIYEDEFCIAFLPNQPSVPGHIKIIPKEHYPILEAVPDKIVGKLFSLANKITTISFQALSCSGTNIIIENGISAGQDTAHLSLNILPRTENDGFELSWDPKEAKPDELSDAELMLKEETSKITLDKSNDEQNNTQLNKNTIAEEPEIIEQKENEIDYRIEQLNRMP